MTRHEKPAFAPRSFLGRAGDPDRDPFGALAVALTARCRRFVGAPELKCRWGVRYNLRQPCPNNAACRRRGQSS